MKNIDIGLIELKNAINRKEIHDNENPEKIVNIAEKIIGFHKKQKGEGIKILTPKQMFQRSLIAGAKVKAEKRIKWNQTNHIFFVAKKRSY